MCFGSMLAYFSDDVAGQRGNGICVVISMWSDSPLSVSES